MRGMRKNFNENMTNKQEFGAPLPSGRSLKLFSANNSFEKAVPKGNVSNARSGTFMDAIQKFDVSQTAHA